MVGILGGKLPLPRDTVIGPMRDRVIKQIAQTLPAYQQRADVTQEGAVNGDGVKALLCEMLLQTLNDQPAAPVVCLPLFSRGNRMSPFKVTNVSIVDNTLSFTVMPMNASERTELLTQIKQTLADGTNFRPRVISRYAVAFVFCTRRCCQPHCNSCALHSDQVSFTRQNQAFSIWHTDCMRIAGYPVDGDDRDEHDAKPW